MKSLIIRLTDWVAYGAIAATSIYGYSMGAYFAGYDNNPLNGLLYAAGGFCVASVVSAVWFCLSGAYESLQQLQVEAMRARVRATIEVAK